MKDSNESLPEEAATTAIAAAAAEWVVLQQREMTREEESAFHAWLQEDPRHASLYAEMSETSGLLDRLRDPGLQDESATVIPISRPRPFRLSVPSIILAAASLAIAGVFWLLPEEDSALFSESAATEVGGQRELNLPDGSVVLLNTDSAIAVDYTVAQRNVQLTRGEAFFNVARDTSRPFMVHVGSVSVRAVGTAFNVRFRPDAVEVVVKEGRVSVNPATASTFALAAPKAAQADENRHLLQAGQFAKISLARDRGDETSPVEVDAMEAQRLDGLLAWQSGRLEFSETPLAEVAAEFNRYNRHKLVIDDPTLASQTFGGSFAPGGYDSLVDALKSFGVVAVRSGDATILRRAD